MTNSSMKPEIPGFLGRVGRIAIKLSLQHPISNTQYPTGEELDQTLEHGCDGAQPSMNTSFCLMTPGCSPWILDIPCWILDIPCWILDISRPAGSRFAGLDIGYSNNGFICSVPLELGPF